MASNAICRATSRHVHSITCASSQARVNGWRVVASSRGFRTTSKCLAVTNFPMPAMSPTMTEGTISSWKLKEGDSFAAGDVLLEIETDKAQMDVEAQEDGILAKILVQGGKSPIKVGTRIAVLAEEGDDLGSLELPPDDSASTTDGEKKAEATPPKDSGKPQEPVKDTSKSSSPGSGNKGDKDSQMESKSGEDKHDQQPKEARESSVKTVKDSDTTGSRDKNPFKESPGLISLLHQNDLKMSDVKGTGPRGRVLKGDVLAHLGQIDKSKPKSLADVLAKLGKLDLDNIKVKKPETKKAVPENKKEAAAKNSSGILDLEITVELADPEHVSRLAPAALHASLSLPVKPTPDDLFNELLGLSSISSHPSITRRTTAYEPKITPRASPSAAQLSLDDIFDELVGGAPAKPRKQGKGSYAVSIKVPAIDEQRGLKYLNMLKKEMEEPMLSVSK